MATYKVKFRTKGSFNPFQSNVEFITAGSREEAERVIKRRYGNDLDWVKVSFLSEEFQKDLGISGSSGSSVSVSGSDNSGTSYTSSGNSGSGFSIRILIGVVLLYGFVLLLTIILPHLFPSLEGICTFVSGFLMLPVMVFVLVLQSFF